MRYAMNCCKQTASDDGKMFTYTGKCIMTGNEYSVTVPVSGLMFYIGGALIQEAFPELSIDDREFLISGISPSYDFTEIGKLDIIP